MQLGGTVNICYQADCARHRLDYFIEYSIMAVVFFLPLSLDATSFFLAGATALWVWKMIANRHMDFRRTPFDLLVVLLVIISAASIWGAPDREYSIYNYYHLMGRYVLLYYLVINNIRSLAAVRRLMFTLLVSACFVAVYGFYQYIYGVDISAFHWVDSKQFPDLKMRVFSTLYNPNLLAGFLVTIMAIAGGLGLSDCRLKAKLIFFGLIMVMGVCLVLTYSRGAWLSLLAAFVTFGILYNRKLLWLLVLVPAVMLLGHDVFLERMLSIINPTDTSTTVRLALWQSTLTMIHDHPLLGIGWGSYLLVYPHYNFFVHNCGTKIVHAHNMYLHIAAEIGIPGLLVFLALLFGHIRYAYRLAVSITVSWGAGLMLGILAALLGITIGGFTDYVLFNIQMSMIFWLLNAVVVVVYLDQNLNMNRKF